MKLPDRCKHCQRKFSPNPRVKDQQYCSRIACQRARKRRWQKEKMAADSDYRRNQIDCRQKWQKNNSDYWSKYRETHPQYRERNRQLQKLRDVRRKAKHLAKMDTLNSKNNIIPGGYYLIPIITDLAKMDTLMQKIYIIPDSCTGLGESCKKGLDRQPPEDEVQYSTKKGDQ